MLTVQVLPKTEPTHQRHIAEAFFPQAVLTIVASLSFMDREDEERVTEWRVYWMAFGGQLAGGTHDPEAWMPRRVDICAERGEKMPEEVARAIFPHVEGPYRG